MLKVAYTLDVRSFHAAELALPGVERGTADRAHDIRPWQSCPLRQTSGLWWFGVQKTVTSSWLPPGDGLPEVSSFGLHYFKGGVQYSPWTQVPKEAYAIYEQGKHVAFIFWCFRHANCTLEGNCTQYPLVKTKEWSRRAVCHQRVSLYVFCWKTTKFLTMFFSQRNFRHTIL